MSEVWVTGASGMIGQALSKEIQLTAMPRNSSSAPSWKPLKGVVNDNETDIKAIVHLAGSNIEEGRWTKARKKMIRDSRILGSRTLVDWLKTRKQKPKCIISASAIGYYGNRGDQELDEGSSKGDGFLADVVQEWEAEISKANALGIQVICLRFGIVLSTKGGALAKMLPIFKLGGGGPVAGGMQWFSWIHIDDVVGVIRWALDNPQAQGVYNLCAPNPITQGDFSASLARVLDRPAFVPTPAFAIKLAFGEMGEQTVLSSTRAQPSRLLNSDYRFKWTDIDEALTDIVQNKK